MVVVLLGSKCGQGSSCGQGSTWPGVHVVMVLLGGSSCGRASNWFFMWSGFYLAWGSSFHRGHTMCEHHNMGVLIVHHIFVNGHSSLKDCDVAALPIHDMIDGWPALWLVSSGLLCLDESLSWAEL